jgi:superfamily II DNA or RNA helicase
MVSETIRSLKRKYKNQDGEKIGRDLIQPCLKEAIKYRRGTGTFSSSAFKAYVGAIDHFINDDVKIEILCSPKIDLNLLRVLETCNSDSDRHKILQKTTNEILLAAAGCKAQPDRPDYRSTLLAYLIANNKLEIKIALPLNKSAVQVFDSPEDQDLDMDNINTRAMYHIKYGYFIFPDNSVVAFEGSVNETDTALNFNTEKATVYRSWEQKDDERLKDVVEELDNDWEGKNHDIRIYNIDDDALKIIRDQAPTTRPTPPPPKKPLAEPEDERTTPPDFSDNKKIPPLRPYQQEALQKWRANKYQGILAMATGSGKTLTAIHALSNFRRTIPSGFIFIIVPKQNLAVQWIDNLQQAGFYSIPAFQDQSIWYEQFKNEAVQARLSKSNAPCIVAVVNSFKSAEFQELLNSVEQAKEKNHLLIADECHYFNSIKQLSFLPEFIKYRIGLSATPYDQFEDMPESHFLKNYFGDIIFEYSLRDAIDAGFLCKYEYHTVEVSLDEDETQLYEDYSKKIGAAIAKDHGSDERSMSLDALLAARARVVGSAKDKLLKLRELVSKEKKYYCLAYCGDGSGEDENDGKMRQIDQVTRLFRDCGWNVTRITCDESLEEREEIINRLKHRNINVIASIKVLDEGIDIPCCETAYILASRRSEREHIQRRGRILRLSENKDKAILYDFVVTSAYSSSNSIKNLIKHELERVWRFADDSVNGIETKSRLATLARETGLFEED